MTEKVIMETTKSDGFAEDYFGSGSVTETSQKTAIIKPALEEGSFNTDDYEMAKPKRIIIRGKITHD